ncbi:MAG: serine/threonine-protein kinase [Planctomycetota bacterium]|nr:serine/threonine-protein kinase [Planctomycetota bacterium]
MSAEIPERIGKYTIRERIGSGGMGHVYLGTDPESGEQVAVKVLTASLAREEGFVERFNREIDAMRTLAHPHVVKLYDYGVDGENYYLAMEYVRGETLLGMLRRVRRIPWRKAFEIAIEICGALKAAHDHGIIHRDLKPSNLLLDAEEHVRLTDFGVAQVFDTQRLTVTGGVIGTAEYMSPEQAEGKRATKQSDLYSLGVVLYVMVTGRTPFSGNSTVEVMQKHRFGLFDHPRAIVPDLPARVDETICKLLEKDPQKRFPDAYVLLRHLQSVLKIENRVIERGETVTENSDLEEASTTSVAENGDQVAAEMVAQAGHATVMKGLIRAELEEMQKGHPITEWLSTTPALIGLLLALALGVWWLWPRDLTDEQLFERGVALMAQGEGLNYLQARKEAFQPLLERDSDTWGERVKPYLDNIELYDRRRKAGRAGSEPASREAKAATDDVEPRRLIRRAEEYRRTGDVARAVQMLSHLKSLLRDDSARSATSEDVDRLLSEMHDDKQFAATDAYVAETLARAEKLAEQGKNDAAGELLAALRKLYADIPAIQDRIRGVEQRIFGNRNTLPKEPVSGIEAEVSAEETPAAENHPQQVK